MHPHAQAAIRAAKNQHKWGGYATAQYLRNRKVPALLFVLADALETLQNGYRIHPIH